MQSALASNEDLRVMLIDDDESVRDVLTESLNMRGLRVSAFPNAEGAIEELLKASAGYDVLVTDISMPGIGGMEFLQRAREAAPGIPVVMITGYPSIDTAVEAMKLGAADFLMKPFKTDDLEITLRKAVSKAVSSAQLIVKPGKGVLMTPESARKRLEEKIQELSILHTITETLDEATRKDDIFTKTMDIARIISEAERAFIMVVELQRGDAVVQAASGHEDGLTGKRFRLDGEPFRSVINNRCYSHILVEEGPAEELAGGVPGGRKALLLVPMLINKEVVAILGLSGWDEGNEFSEDTMALLLNLAAKSSLKLENMALTENIFSSIIGAINSLINALDARDTYTKDHSSRVTHYALEIARAMGCPQEVIDSISFAGPLHDIGKIAVRDDVLLKKGYLTPDERELVKTHVLRGEEILRPLNLLDNEKEVVLYHHERYDGTGYPNGLDAHKIPIVARIFSVADTFDAMTSTRPYRQALSHEIAREEIIKCSGTQFDPDIVQAFLKCAFLKCKD